MLIKRLTAAFPAASKTRGERYSSSLSSVALPPEAAVFTEITCSKAKRCKRQG
jgi:hypothetical protein